MRMLFTLALGAVALPLAAQAQPQGAPAPQKERINQVIVYGNDPCPRGTEDDEIVICARKSENDRFRIPAPLRSDPNAPANAAWGVKAEQLEYVGRSGIGSCSPSGVGGASGCFNQLVRQARAERAQGDGTNWVALVEAARAERVGRIDADSVEIEERVKAEEAARAAAKKAAAEGQTPPQ